MNIAKAIEILEKLAKAGVQTLCLCPGARNAPFVLLLAKNKNFEVINFFDERSAGFFALGRARRDSRPVAVLTTSGTAVSELLSPMIEAYHSDLPLIALTSDRPKRLRGTGAPQTIDQSQIFSGFVENSWDIAASDPFDFNLSYKKPAHINVCFDEPLIDAPIAETALDKGVVKVESPQRQPLPSLNAPRAVVIVGALRAEQRPWVSQFLRQQDVPVFAEALSGLKNDPHLQSLLLGGGEKSIGQLLRSGEVQSAVRIGDIPVGKYWRELDLMKIPTINLTDKNFSGLETAQTIEHSLQRDLSECLRLEPWNWSVWREKDQKWSQEIAKLFRQFPCSEMALTAQLSQIIPAQDSVYLGNSLPVRFWDLVDFTHSQVYASRGVNGIDGQLSTGLGLVKPRETMWILLGDLTTLYDFSGFWLTEYLQKQEANVNLVVVNNQGGQIFARMFNEKLFINQHNLEFSKIAEMWNWNYQKVTSGQSIVAGGGLNLLELFPNANETQAFWQQYDQLWQN